MIENKEEFIKFLIRAKQSTYAGDGQYSKNSRPGSTDLQYREGNFQYIDTYLGNSDFIGQEVVWVDGKAIWGMNYFGKMLTTDIPDGFVDCLKLALKNPPKDAPYRGPKLVQTKEFEYHCNWKGDLDLYEGNEQILMNGKEIYNLKFNGGFLE
ncbi:MAG: DUF5680 domain-containing protein [Marinifilaceae bacterium]